MANEAGTGVAMILHSAVFSCREEESAADRPEAR